MWHGLRVAVDTPSLELLQAKAENRRAQLNLQRQLAEQEALLSRQEEQDMYAYLKSTPTFGTVKDNFVLPGATAK